MIHFVALGGFLGAGKTTTMLAAGQWLEHRGETVSVVTNDQGVDLVDTQLAQATGLAAVQEVTGGCFCCRFDDLATVIGQLQEDVAPTVVLAEAVGSCTDLQSTVVRPLRHLHGDSLRVSPLTVVLDPLRFRELGRWSADPTAEPDLAYLYRHQLDEADIIAINKSDMLAPDEIHTIREDVARNFPHAAVVSYSATTGSGMDELIALWTSGEISNHRPFAVDYDRYGAAEAELAWTNQTFTLAAESISFSPARWVTTLLGKFSEQTAADGATVGHVKARLASPSGTTKASLTASGGPTTFDQRDPGPVAHAEVTLNARVQLSPQQLEDLIEQSVTAADASTRTKSGPRQGRVFQPGFPQPVHRM